MSDSTTVPAAATPLLRSSPEPPTVTQELGAAMRRGELVAYIAGYFGIWLAFFSPILIVLPTKIEQLAPGDKSSALSLILGGGAAFGILTPPVAGRLSDRCTSRFGRRRPWLVGSMLLGVVGLVVEAVSSNLPVLFLGFSLVAVAFGVAMAVILAVLPERIPVARRGKVSGYLGVVQSLAVVVGVGVTGALSKTSVPAAFVVPGVVGTALVLWLVAVLSDRTITAADRPPLSIVNIFSSFWISPRRHPDFGWAWLSRFAIFMAFSGTVNYQAYFLRDQLGVAENDTAALVAAGTIAQVAMVVVSSALAGRLSDRVRRRKVFAIVSSLLCVLGLATVAFTPGLPLYFVGLAIVGLGQGAYFAVDLALVSDLLPARRDDDARYLGVFSLANQVPTSLAPAIAPAFLAIGVGAAVSGDNYTALFLASAVFAVLAAVTVARVRSIR